MSWPSLVPVCMAKSSKNKAETVAPLVLPWKYGFKGIKSVVRITFTGQRPLSFWEQLAANEYGFWANVNPQVEHALVTGV